MIILTFPEREYVCEKGHVQMQPPPHHPRWHGLPLFCLRVLEDCEEVGCSADPPHPPKSHMGRWCYAAVKEV